MQLSCSWGAGVVEGSSNGAWLAPRALPHPLVHQWRAAARRHGTTHDMEMQTSSAMFSNNAASIKVHCTVFLPTKFGKSIFFLWLIYRRDTLWSHAWHMDPTTSPRAATPHQPEAGPDVQTMDAPQRRNEPASAEAAAAPSRIVVIPRSPSRRGNRTGLPAARVRRLRRGGHARRASPDSDGDGERDPA
eukprot:363108-Chlamydomonas_euryale.AAC.4